MAIIEIHFSEQVFFNIIAAQVLRVDPPSALTDQLPAGFLIERIDPHDIVWASSSEVLFGDDELAVKVPLTVHITNYEMAKAAGSLQAPTTIPVPATVWLRLQGAPPSSLRWSIQRVEVQGQFVPVLAPPQTIDLGSIGSDVSDIILAAGAGVAAIRLVTSTGGGHLGAVTNRLGGADWGQVIQGQVFADSLAHEVNEAANSAAAGSSDPQIIVSSTATGYWDQKERAAFTSVDVVALDALPADICVPITVYASLRIGLDAVLDRLVLTTRITWASHDVITVVSSGLISVVEDKVSEALLNRLKPPQGQEEIERGDDYVVFRSTRPFLEPNINLFRATVDQLDLNGSGASATGRVHVAPRPMAHFILEDQHWESHTDCGARQYKTEFHPPRVLMFNTDRHWLLRFLQDPTVDPPGAWSPRASWPGFQVAQVEFGIPPGGVQPVGSQSSGFIVTSLGVRWVDLGAVPARPPAPADPIAIQAYVISTCMAISDPWGMGIFNLHWLVDPPDLDLGMPALREWTLVMLDVGDPAQINLSAVGPNGEHHLTRLVTGRTPMVVQVITDATETLQVRRAGRAGAPAPQVLQRWIVPWASVPVADDAHTLRLTASELFVTGDRGVTRLELPQYLSRAVQAPHVQRPETNDISASAIPAVESSFEHARRAALRTAGVGRSVAVLHRGQAVLGFAGPLVPVTEGLMPRETRE